MKVNAVVLAGGTLKDSKKDGYKAFLPLGKQSMLEKVVSELKESEHINKIIVANLPRVTSIEPDGFEIMPGKGNIVQTIASVLPDLPNPKTVLVACDIPLITSKMVDDLIEECSKFEADFYYPLIPKEEVLKKYPTTKRTYFKLIEGSFTGGNILLISNSVFLQNERLANEIYEKRKKPIQLVKILGPKFLYSFIRKNLSLADAERKASDIINGRAKAIITPYPEIGTDVDKKSDYELAKALIGHEGN